MSNNTNLSKLANVLDDGSDGQYLKSTGSGGVVFDAVAAGTTTVADITALEALTAAQGDMAFVLSNDNVYIRKTAGWYKIATVTNDQLQSVTVTMSGGGTAGAPYLLALDGTDTLATGAATDPEGLSVTWSAAPISPATLSGSNIVVSSVNVATITQGTGASSNVFTLDPVATTGTHNFSVRFSVTDGINATINADKDYTLNFVLTVDDSKYTTMLAQAVGANNGTNSSITDSHSSSSPHTITTSGSPVAGTFSPYRSGGYSTYFDGTGDYIETTSSNYALGTSSAFTLELWYYFDESRTHTVFDFLNSSNGEVGKLAFTSGNVYLYDGSANILALTRTQAVGSWEHFCWTRDASNNHVFYINGTQVGTSTASTNIDSQTLEFGRRGGSFNSTFMKGYLSDVRLVKGTVITPPSGGPTERLEAVTNTELLTCHLPYIADGSTNDHSITVNGNTSTKPFGPYDYSEYSAADHGGSVYFDGSGDYLKHQFPALGTGDFEISCWIYASTLDFKFIFDYRFGATNNPFAATLANGKIRVYTEGDILIDSAAGVITAGQWYYIAYKRVSGTSNLYVNGNSVGSATDTTSFASVTNGYVGRRYDVSSYMWDGYISDFRIITTPTSSGYAIPTAPLSSSGTSLHIKGTDASIIDKSGSDNLTLVGDTKCSTAQVKFAGSKSIYFDGSGDYITLGRYVDIAGDFTFEAWVKPSTAWSGAVGSLGGDTDSGAGSVMRMNGSGNLSVYSNHPSNGGTIININGTYNPFTSTSNLNGATLTDYAWTHLALSRTGSTVYLYVNGIRNAQTGSGTGNLYFDIIGGQLSSGSLSNPFSGYIQDLRVSTKARYTASDETSNIPTAPLEG